MESIFFRLAVATFALFGLSPAVADVYYTEIIELKDGVTVEQISDNWERHKALWIEKGGEAKDTALSTKVVGNMNSRQMSFFFRADNQVEYGELMNAFFADPDWQKMTQKWDELRIIVTAEVFQTID